MNLQTASPFENGMPLVSPPLRDMGTASYQGTASAVPNRRNTMTAFRRCFSIPSAILAICSAFAVAQSGPSYTITLTSPAQHLAEVHLILPAGPAHRELQMPVWNALYQVRDFAQYINWIHAKDRSGKLLAIHALNSSRWEIDHAEMGAVIDYQIFLDSPGPFGAQLNPHHAFLNLAQVLIYSDDTRNGSIHLHFNQIPDGWRIATPLSSIDNEFSAANYDRLVDSPIELGNFQEQDFDESGAHFRVIVDAEPSDYDLDKIVSNLHKITAAAISWMNDRPFESYMFLYHFPRGPAGGGMEHAYSTAIDIGADVVKQNLYPVNAVTAHEFFHLWNVKRIRPQTLEPVDYTKANFTRALWFSEGVTSTAEGTIQLRGGLIDEKQYLAELGDQITELERRPAHLTQSAEGSSLDAWLEGDSYYRRPERSISYYNKGELLGVLLDLAVRDASRGHASLREVLQWMNENYAKQGRFFDDSNGVRQAAEAVTHADLSDFFNKYVAGTEDISWDSFFQSVGLRVEKVPTTIPDPGFIASRNFDGPMTVAVVTPGSDAEHAGLQTGDIITEIQGKPAGQESRQELTRVRPGDTFTIKVRNRRTGERELKWNVAGREEISSEIKDVDRVTPEQRSRRAAWLKGEAQTNTDSARAGAN